MFDVRSTDATLPDFDLDFFDPEADAYDCDDPTYVMSEDDAASFLAELDLDDPRCGFDDDDDEDMTDTGFPEGVVWID